MELRSLLFWFVLLSFNVANAFDLIKVGELPTKEPDVMYSRIVPLGMLAVAPSRAFLVGVYGHGATNKTIYRLFDFNLDSGLMTEKDSSEISPMTLSASGGSVARTENGDLFYFTGGNGPGTGRVVTVRKSTDLGVTWSTAFQIGPESGAEINAFGLSAVSSSLFMSMYKILPDGTRAAQTLGSFDNGLSWSVVDRFSELAGAWCFARNVVKNTQDRLYLVAGCKKNGVGFVTVRESQDGGHTWSEVFRIHDHHDIGGVLPVANGSIIFLTAKKINALVWQPKMNVYNPTQKSVTETLLPTVSWMLSSQNLYARDIVAATDGSIWANVAVVVDGDKPGYEDNPNSTKARQLFVSRDQGLTWTLAYESTEQEAGHFGALTPLPGGDLLLSFRPEVSLSEATSLFRLTTKCK